VRNYVNVELGNYVNVELGNYVNVELGNYLNDSTIMPRNYSNADTG
jgi:hypothetical protein